MLCRLLFKKVVLFFYLFEIIYFVYIYTIYSCILDEWSKEAYNLVHSAGTCGIAQALIEGRIDNNVYANIYFNVPNYGVNIIFRKFRIFDARFVQIQINRFYFR